MGQQADFGKMRESEFLMVLSLRQPKQKIDRIGNNCRREPMQTLVIAEIWHNPTLLGIHID